MIYAERGNKVVSIREEAIQRYVEQGYTIKDETGAVIKATVPVDIPNLKKSYVEQMQKIDSLQSENAYLKSEIENLKKQLAEKPAKSTKAEKSEVVDEAEPEVVAEKPKRQTKAKATE